MATAEYILIPSHCRKCGVHERLYAHGTKAVEYRDTPARWSFASALRLARVKGAVGMIEVTHRTDADGRYGLGHYADQKRMFGDEKGFSLVMTP